MNDTDIVSRLPDEIWAWESVEPIEFEWNIRKPTRGYGRLNAARCWNEPFFYGDGEPATEASVIIRRSDYESLRTALAERDEQLEAMDRVCNEHHAEMRAKVELILKLSAALAERDERIATLENDLADALDLKSGVGPTVLSALVADRDALRTALAERDAEAKAFFEHGAERGKRVHELEAQLGERYIRADHAAALAERELVERDEMGQTCAKWLRQMAEEIRAEGHNGWGNTLDDVIAYLESKL